MRTLKILFIFFVVLTGLAIAFTAAQLFVFDPHMMDRWGMNGSIAGFSFAFCAILAWGAIEIMPWIQRQILFRRKLRRLRKGDLAFRPDPMARWTKLR